MEYTLEQAAQISFKFFFVKVLGYTWAPHFDEWQWLIENNQRFVLMCARGHGKTKFLIGFALWLIYKELPVDILFMSHSEDQVKTNVMNEIDTLVMTNEYLFHLRPSTKQLWGAQLKTFKTGAHIRGESFGSSIRGLHPDYIFEDDPLKDKGAMTPEEQFNYHSTVVEGMCKKNTIMGVIGTPLDNGDLLEQLERLGQGKAYVTKKYPGRKEDGTPLFPTLYDEEALKQKEISMGSFGFSREIMLQRLDPKTQVFADRFRTINIDCKLPEDLRTVRTKVDPAISEKDGACDSAIVTSGIDPKNHIWEISTKLEKSDNPKTILDYIVKEIQIHHKKYNDYAVVIESEVFQKVLAYDLKQIILEKNLNVRIIEIAHSGTQGKHERIMGLQNKWEAYAIHLLPESPLIPQFRYYRPGVRGVKIDGIDALSMMRLEDVAVPIGDPIVVDPGVPNEAWE